MGTKSRSQHGVREHLGAAHVRLPETGGAHVVRLDAGAKRHVPAQHIDVDTHAVGGVRVLADQDDGLTAGGSHRAHAVPRLPQTTPRRVLIEQPELADRGHSKRHVLERDHAASAELVHADATIRVDDDVNARATTGQRIARVLIARRGSDTHSPEGVHGIGQSLAAHAAQLPGDHPGLPVALSGGREVREFSATDASRTGLGPHGGNPIGRCLDDLDDVRPRELLLDGGHPRTDNLTWCRVAHEDDASGLVACDAGAAVCGLPDGQAKDLADALTGLRESGTAARGGTAMRRARTHGASWEDRCGVCAALEVTASGAGTRRNGSPVFGSAVWDAQCIHTPA